MPESAKPIDTMHEEDTTILASQQVMNVLSLECQTTRSNPTEAGDFFRAIENPKRPFFRRMGFADVTPCGAYYVACLAKNLFLCCSKGNRSSLPSRIKERKVLDAVSKPNSGPFTSLTRQGTRISDNSTDSGAVLCG